MILFYGLRVRLLSFFLFVFLLFSCGSGTYPALFPAGGTGSSLSALSRDASQGVLDFAKPKKIAYRFEPSFNNDPFNGPSCFEIEYHFTALPSEEIKRGYQLVLELGANADNTAWELPMDLSFLGIDAAGNEKVIHYAVPTGDSFSGEFSITLASQAENPALVQQRRQAALPCFQIRSVKIKERWFGYYDSEAENRASDGSSNNTVEKGGHFFTSPFVFRQEAEEQGGFVHDAIVHDVIVITPPAVFGAGENSGFLPELRAGLLAGKTAVLAAGNRRFEASPNTKILRVPPGFLSGDGPFVISGDRVESFRLSYAAPPSFPSPVTADPGLILDWPRDRWRDRRYEVFRWEQFPSLLIFDTADYAVQDRMLKRLAFFVEKAGFRGRLAPDAEIAGLHGWNAHDYRAADLARFFEAARLANFPLLPEERELERILRNEGIIRTEGGGIAAGEGGIVSISRESAGYLRNLFMAHEGFHGIYFIDEDFRSFTRRRWEQFPPAAKRFILSYFDYQHYDIKDEYLVINEFMAHLLQQPVSQAAVYFGETLPSRIETTSWRRAALPEKDEARGNWPALAAAFTAEAEAFSAYVNRRWSLAAGRVRQITLRGN